MVNKLLTEYPHPLAEEDALVVPHRKVTILTRLSLWQQVIIKYQ